MPFKLKWTTRASGHLDDIYAYIAADRPASANEEVLTIIARAEQLLQFPMLGHVYRHPSEIEVREIVVENYRVFYTIKTALNRIDILSVWHGARGEPDIL
jgi:toxin ParE1/3/4